MKKRMLGMLLAIVMVVGLCCMPALAADAVSYVEYSWDGTALSSTTQTVTDYIEVTSETATWSDGGWYVVSDDVTIDARVEVTGDVHLILTDGNSLTVTGDVSFGEGVSLAVYGQAQGTGALTVGGGMANGSNSSQNGGNGGSVTVNGGKVTVTDSIASGGNGREGNAGSSWVGGRGGSGGSVTVNGGTVTVGGSIANGGSGGNGVPKSAGLDGAGRVGGNGGNGGSVTVNGGKVEVTGSIASGGSGGNGGNGENDNGGNGANGGNGNIVTVSGGTVVVGGNIASGGSGGNGGSGDSWPGGNGGSGGNGNIVTVSGGTVTVGGSIASGGSGGNGGRGGNVGEEGTGGNGGSGDSVTVNGGTVEVTGSIASGGRGGSGGGADGNGGRGGNGGSVTVNGGKATVTDSIACGGNGGNSSVWGEHYGRGGAGGDGGMVTVSGGTVEVTGSIANGGTGGRGWARYGRGGSGGSGGSVTVVNGSTVTVGGSIVNGGDTVDNGHGGDGGTVTVSGGTVEVTGGMANGKNGGNSGGDGGTVTVSGGTVTVGGSIANVGSGRTVGADGSATGIIYKNNDGTVYGDVTMENDIEIPEGTTLTVPAGASLTVNGTITNNGTLRLQTKDSLTVTGSITGGGENRILSITAEQIIVPTDLVYNGTDQTDVASSRILLEDAEIIFGANFTYDTAGWNFGSISPAEVKDAGNYTVSYKNGENTISTTFFVGKKVVTDENTTVGGFASMTYNGQAQPLASDLVVDLGDGRTETITGVTWSTVTNVTDTTTAAVETKNFTGTVSKPTGMEALDLSTVTIEKNNALTYNGTEQTQQITVKELGGMILTGYAVSGNTASTVKTDGNYTLTVSADGNTNYTGSKTFEWNIEPAPLTATAVIPEIWWGETPVIENVTISGTVYDPDVVTVTGLTAAPANEASIGDSVTFNVDSSNAVISGDGSVNYAVTVAETATGKVKVIPLTISGVGMDAESYTYGEPVGCDTSALDIQQHGGAAAKTEDLVYTYTGTANDGTEWNDTAAPTKAGSYTLTVSHSDAVHYSGSQSVDFTIERKSVEEPDQAAAVTYNGQAQTYAVTETAYYTVTGGVQTAANEAGYDVTISLEDPDNYKWKTTGNSDDLTHSFVINKAPVTVTAKNQRYHIGTRLPGSSDLELGKHYTVDGLFGEDSIGTVTVKYQKDGKNVTPNVNQTGIYDIIPVVTNANSNYVITWVNGELIYYYNAPTYKPTIEDTTGGEIIVDKKNPEKGDKVTITAKPEAGYEVGKVTVTDSKGNPVKVIDNGDGTYTFKQPAGKVEIKVIFEEISEIKLPFTDVSKEDDHYEAVAFMYENGLMVGVGDGTQFAPSMSLSRAMIAQILYRYEKEPESVTSNFSDVPRGFWYTKAIDWASANGVVSGDGKGNFFPNQDVTREQLAVMLYQYAKSKSCDVDLGDALTQPDRGTVSFWAAEAMQWAVSNGILVENGIGYLAATDAATRLDVAEAFMAFVNLYA